VITYAVPADIARANATIEIRDSDGTLVDSLPGRGTEGVHTVVWDLIPPGGELARGQYNDRQEYVIEGVYDVFLIVGSAKVEAQFSVMP
jgi:flagellar hook assembly protein FlgD